MFVGDYAENLATFVCIITWVSSLL